MVDFRKMFVVPDDPFAGTERQARERRSQNRLFVAGIVVYAAFLCWFHVLNFGFFDGADLRLAERLTRMVEDGFGLTTSNPEKSAAFILYQARVIWFLPIELAFFAFAFAVHGKWIFRLPNDIEMLKQSLIPNFLLLLYLMVAVWFLVFGAAFTCEYRDCGRKALGEPMLYFLSFLLIAIAPCVLSIAIRRVGLHRTEY